MIRTFKHYYFAFFPFLKHKWKVYILEKRKALGMLRKRQSFWTKKVFFLLCFFKKKNEWLFSKIISTEQEKLLQELREQNDTANLNIQVKMNI